MKTTLIIGASTNPARYSYLAAKRLLEHNIKFHLVGLKEENLFGNKIYKYGTLFEDIHTITMYIGPKNQIEHYQYILSLKPKRIIFNPGTENPEFYSMLLKNKVPYIEACTLVLLSTGQY